MSIALAITLQVIGSFSFAAGAILQSSSVRREFDPAAEVSNNKLSFRGLLRQFVQPRWVLGLLCVFLGAGFHLVALSQAPVAIVEPIGILAVPWSVLLAARISRHRVTGRIWLAVAMTITGVVGFTFFATQYASDERAHFEFEPIVVAFVIVSALAAVMSMVARRVPGWAKAMTWATVGAVFYGLASGLMKSAINLTVHHERGLLTWQVLIVAACLGTCFMLGVWMIQQGYASGPPEITVGTMTVVDPVIAVLFGLIVLGEAGSNDVTPLVGMVAFFLLAAYGVARLSKDHPEATKAKEPARPRERVLQ